MKHFLWMTIVAWGVASLGGLWAAEDQIPFPDALHDAAVSVDRLDSILDNALLIGNGDINGLVYSQGGSLRMMLTKNDVWDARLDSKLDPPLPKLDWIKKVAAQSAPSSRGHATISPDGWGVHGSADSYHAHPYPCPRPCARLTFGDRPDRPVDQKDIPLPTISGRLDIRRAVVETVGDTKEAPRAAVRALADRNVFLIDTDSSIALSPIVTADCPAAVVGESGEVAWISQQIPGDLDWPGMSYAVARAQRGGVAAVAIVTSREAKDPRAAAIGLARATLTTGHEEMIARHERVWDKFWSKSGVQLGDGVLQTMWYRNLYFLRCVTKPGVIAPGLFASLIHDQPAWHGDYHTNYNIQQTFWTAFSTNHVELAEPYNALIRDYFPRARWIAREVFDMEGAYYPHVLFAYEPPHPERCKSPVGRQYIHHVWGFTMGVAGFTVQPVWWHYKYSPDRKFLEETAYPAVRDVAVWQAEFIDQCDGDATVVLAPSVSPEHWGWTKDFERNRNCTFDIAMFRYIFEAAIEGATTLGRDPQMVARWQRSLKRLPNYPTTKTDTPIVVDVEDAPPINYNIAVPAVPVFPGDLVTWRSPPEEKELFRRTIEGLQWNGNNSVIILAVARARLSMPGTADWLRKELLARLRPNGTLTLNVLGHGLNNFGHYTEQFAASMAVCELLLQSVGDTIRVFPAWPSDVSGRFENLRAQGGFLVSAEMSAGQIGPVRVTSTVGGTLTMLSPWPKVTLRRGDGRRIVVEPDADGLIRIETVADERLVLEVGAE